MSRIIGIIITLLCSTNLVGQDTTETIVTTEGFYSHGFESSTFYEIYKDNLLQSKIAWLKISDTLPESQKKIIRELPTNKSVYIMFEAIKRTGGNYGHLGAANVEFEIISLIAIDLSYTIEDFLE